MLRDGEHNGGRAELAKASDGGGNQLVEESSDAAIATILVGDDDVARRTCVESADRRAVEGRRP